MTQNSFGHTLLLTSVEIPLVYLLITCYRLNLTITERNNGFFHFTEAKAVFYYKMSLPLQQKRCGSDRNGSDIFSNFLHKTYITLLFIMLIEHKYKVSYPTNMILYLKSHHLHYLILHFA